MKKHWILGRLTIVVALSVLCFAGLGCAPLFAQETAGDPKPHIELDIAGQPGNVRSAVVVKRADGNNAPRKGIVLQKYEDGKSAKITVGGGKVSVWDAQDGGNKLNFNGTDNVFANTALPKTLYVQGDAESGIMGDVTVRMEAVDDATKTSVL